MGETAADTRREKEATRSDLGDTIQQLRSRSVVIRERAIKFGAMAGAGTALAGIAAAGIIAITRRRGGGPVARAARRLPSGTHGAAVPAAQATDRWIARRSTRLQQRRDVLIELLSQRIADSQAQAQRRANPLWRRTLAKALETAATVGIGALIRRLLQRRTDRRAAEETAASQPAPDELAVTGSRRPGSGKTAHARAQPALPDSA